MSLAAALRLTLTNLTMGPAVARRMAGATACVQKNIHMTQIGRNAFIPVIGLHAFNRVPFIARGIVDQDLWITLVTSDSCDGSAQGGDVTQVTGPEVSIRLYGMGGAAGDIKIKKGYARALLCELRDHFGADARGAAGDYRDPARRLGYRAI